MRQLAAVKDWLGEIRIERDSKGDPISITDQKGRIVHYEWGNMGQRQGMIYPDGTKISWKYDTLLRLTHLTRIAEGKETLWIDYKYDQQGHLSEKKSSGGYITEWKYNETGLLGELSHKDSAGILDRFHYTYDLMGNRIAIVKERRGFPEESGSYQYNYDALQRLTEVERDGKLLRRYQYDTFGNRTEVEDHANGIHCISVYDVLNRLQEQDIWEKGIDAGNAIHKTFTYDQRGNLTGEYQDGELLHGYSFDSMNRLQRAWNHQGMDTEYIYNALGQRIEKHTGGEIEDYLLDLTKSYHNLLGLKRDAEEQMFYYDFGVAAMEQSGKMVQYTLSDELGSPLRVLYRNGYGDIYGYDEFGKDLFDSDFKEYYNSKYTKQGQKQPFGYTGYRFDDVSETYFAQAREYRPDMGRFTAEDIIRGNCSRPEKLNQYKYCLNNPFKYVDLNGMVEEYTAVIYLLNEGTGTGETDNGPLGKGGAFGQGHAAILLVKDDGTGDFFSYAGAVQISAVLGSGSKGYLSVHTNEDGNRIDVNVDEFLKSGELLTDRVELDENGEHVNLYDYYSHGIYMPITNEMGMAMYDKAMEIRNNPEKYQLTNHNCNQVAQLILEAGGRNFAPANFDWLDTRPNNVYRNMTEWIFENKPKGWRYGRLNMLRLGALYDEK